MAELGIATTGEKLWQSADRAAEGTQLWSERSASLLDVAFEHPIALIASARGRRRKVQPSRRVVLDMIDEYTDALDQLNARTNG